MKFYTTIVQEEDRRTEQIMGMSMPEKYEEITLSVRMTGSGDTTNFTTEEILGIVMEKLKEIAPKAD